MKIPVDAITRNVQPEIKSTSSDLTFANRLDHLMARLGVKRNRHLIEPGLYVFGKPTKDSPVFVSANYTLSFDALRSALAGIDGYILVLDTKGINVWCAAGKGTFGTDELVNSSAYMECGACQLNCPTGVIKVDSGVGARMQ